jgi:hypothetical protein
VPKLSIFGNFSPFKNRNLTCLNYFLMLVGIITSVSELPREESSLSGTCSSPVPATEIEIFK